MTRGYVMVRCEAGKEGGAFTRINDLSWVNEVHPLFGEYDFILHVMGENPDQLARVIIDELRNIEGIISTKTFLEATFNGIPVNER
jgi:DNA-binding Lrp family transcriptional regulator